MPSVRPNDRNSQETIVQRRTARSHESSRRPVMSAAMQNAYGMVIPTKPTYSDGGWITMYGFCRSGFNPRPLVGASVRYVSKGFLCTIITNRKNSWTSEMTATL